MHLGTPTDHDARVQYAVLLGANDLLAGHEQNLSDRCIRHLEGRDLSPLVDLGDLERAGGERLVEGRVVEVARAVPEQTEHLKPVRRDLLADADVLQEPSHAVATHPALDRLDTGPLRPRGLLQRFHLIDQIRPVAT